MNPLCSSVNIPLFQRTCRKLVATALLIPGLLPTASAQEVPDRYFPLRHDRALGDNARMHAFSRRVQHTQLQPVEIVLPSDGTITCYQGSGNQAVELSAPGRVRVLSGFHYRFKIAEMPEFPGVELYPTVEILDQLRPPEGLADQFPIPVLITADEIRSVLDGQMVTKVIYVEQPQVASSINPQSAEAIEDFQPDANLLVEADKRGRPLVTLRLGGRQPSRRGDNHAFFFSGSPLEIVAQPSTSTGK